MPQIITLHDNHQMFQSAFIHKADSLKAKLESSGLKVEHHAIGGNGKDFDLHFRLGEWDLNKFKRALASMDRYTIVHQDEHNKEIKINLF